MAALHPYTTRCRGRSGPPSYTTLRGTTLTRDLASFGRATVPCLVTALHSDQAPVRRHAADVLSYIGADADGVTDALAHALQDPDDQVRLSAAMALYELRTPAAQRTLARQSRADDPRLRAIANRAQSRTAGNN